MLEILDAELGVVAPPLELLLLDAVLLCSEVVRDIGLGLELDELDEVDEDDEYKAVSFPSVALDIPPVQSARRAQMSAQKLPGE